jgi:hypothetical protein
MVDCHHRSLVAEEPSAPERDWRDFEMYELRRQVEQLRQRPEHHEEMG